MLSQGGLSQEHMTSIFANIILDAALLFFINWLIGFSRATYTIPSVFWLTISLYS
jgi:hypothetical protein